MHKILISVVLALPMAALAAPPKTAVLDVQKLTCSLCSITVEKALQKVAGVVAARVDMDKKTATVTFDPDKRKGPGGPQTSQELEKFPPPPELRFARVPQKTGPAALVKATTDAGFPSKPHAEPVR